MLLTGFQNGNASARIYARAVEQAFFYGRHQIPLAQLEAESPFAQALTAQQLEEAYALGRMAGEKATAQRQAEVQASNKRQTSKKGRLYFEGDRGSLTNRQKVSLQTCEVIAKALGIDVHVFESQKGADGKRIGDQGWYDPADGSIHIDLYAGQNGEGVMVFTLSHELVHFIKDWSPAKFRKLAGFLAEQYGKKGVSVHDLVLEQQVKAKEAGRNLSFERAYEEWVADSMETMLTDGTVAAKLAQLQATDKGLAQKIREFINSFVDRLKNAYKGVSAQTKEGQIVSEMVDAAQELQDLFADALIDAGNTYRSTEKNTTDDGGVRYQTRYDGVDLANDPSVYTWDFLTNAPDMQTTILPEVNNIRNNQGKVDARTVIDAGLENAKNVGTEIGGKVFVRNTYTGRNLRVDTASIRHGLNGDSKRILTNARLGAVIGDVVKNAIPINALHNKAIGVKGTYAMAAYAKDSKSREFVAIVTVEERSGEIAGVEAYDVTHALSGRQKNSSRADTKSQGVNPSTTAKISISEFLYTVKSTHQSILSSDVLANIGGAKDMTSYYAQQSKFSSRTADGVSPRELLLNTVEGMVANDTEYKMLQQYRRKIQELNATEEHLQRLNAQLKELYFAEGGRDYELINKLEAQRKEALAKLNRYDGQLISLENTKPIRDIVERMKKAAYERGFQKAKDYYRQKSETREQNLRQQYQESRRNAVERHDKAQIRQQIRKDVERLASLLNKGNKQKNVKQELQAFAGAALRTAKGTFLNNYNEYDMVRNGLNTTMNREQKQIFQRCQELLAELDKNMRAVIEYNCL